jgi:hypothetical protein
MHSTRPTRRGPRPYINSHILVTAKSAKDLINLGIGLQKEISVGLKRGRELRACETFKMFMLCSWDKVAGQRGLSQRPHGSLCTASTGKANS